MKLKIHILNRLIQELNSKEINLLIYLAQRQNQKTALVRNVYYKDVAEHTQMSKSHFYNCLRSLEEKGFIQVDYSNSNSKFYNVKVLNNEFPNIKSMKKYLNLNYDFFNTAQFMHLDARIKKFLLRVFSLKDIKEQLDFTSNKLKEYGVLDRIEELKLFLSVKEYNNKFYFRVVTELTKKSKFELNTYLEHKLRTMCNKYNISFNRKEFQDTLEMYAYYFSLNQEDQESNKYLSRLMRAFDICIQYKKLIPGLVRNVCKTGNVISKKIDITKYIENDIDYFDNTLEDIFNRAILNNL